LKNFTRSLPHQANYNRVSSMGSVLTGIVLTKNEEKNIKRALVSLSFCDEILVVDDESSDKTVQIAASMGAIMIRHKLNNNFSAQRNFALQKSRGDWILFLDADEQVSSELKEEIVSLIKNKTLKNVSYYIKRRDYFWGRELYYGDTVHVRSKGLIRLMKKNSGSWVSPVHETFRSFAPIGQLEGYINHYPHQNVREFLQDINHYSTLRAKELFKKGITTNIILILLYPFGKFFWTYFFQLGFLDGPAGFIYAFMMSFHSFLVRAKLYQYRRIDFE